MITNNPQLSMPEIPVSTLAHVVESPAWQYILGNALMFQGEDTCLTAESIALIWELIESYFTVCLLQASL